ncbi:MAG: hypothetical protein COA90_10515 [Gammaproteobacteria bacterium]|nr:MAG: hypothetical protein COA90_10515 [Gammaproteobacteria bacterium]
MEALLIGGVATAMALILSAWLMTFAKWYPIAGIDGTFDFATMIRAHVDYALMSLFNFGFYGAAMGAGIELPIIACWCVAIGGFTNPTIFVVAALDENFWDKMIWKVLSGISFLITTVGFVWIAITFVKYALSVW